MGVANKTVIDRYECIKMIIIDGRHIISGK